MKYLLTLFIILTLPLTALPQLVVRGKVSEAASGEPIPGANVMVKNTKGKLIGFSASDGNGDFSININEHADSLMINASMLGYRPFSSITGTDGKPISILLEEGALQLQEVVVKADRIRENGDTITYSVSSFAQKQDKSIGDVLRRMPGIDVSDNGKIQYQGTDINKFYIEGSDMLGGKYGVATNGIAHDDIGAVEVMENHQPMQVLRGLSFSDQAAVNLKLKNRAKATLLVHGSLGGGWSQQPRGALWQGDVFSMMVTGRYQMITTLKGNNTGLDISGQLKDFFSDGAEERLAPYISVSSPQPPDMQENRSYLNRSWVVSSGHLLKTRRGGEFKAQLDYSHDRLTAHGESSTTYFLDGGDKVILEDRNSLSRRNALTGKFAYEANEKSYFLSNTLSADFSWVDRSLETTGSVPNTQEASTPRMAVCNLLKVIRRFGANRLVTFNSRNEWSSLPERLSVVHDGVPYGQRISQHAFLTDERASLGFVIRRVLVSLETGIAGYFRSLGTDMWGVHIAGLDDSGNLTTDYLRVFASPKFEWNCGRLELTFAVPLNMYSYFFSGGLRDRTELFVAPSLAARFRLSPRMSLTLRASARRSPASLHNIHDSSVLTDYRSFSAGVDDYYSTSGQSLSASYSFRNVQGGLFVSALGSYGWNRSKSGVVQEVIGDYIFHSFRKQPSRSRNATALINVSKTLDFMGGAVGVKGSFMRMDNSLISQGRQTDYRNGSFSMSPFMNGNVSSFLNWNLRFTWQRSALQISEMPGRCSDSFIYSGTVTLTPCPLITWTTGGEFYRNQIEQGRFKNMMMLDTRLSFNISRRLEISASATNLLNRKDYTSTSYGTVSQTERSSRLRGREFMISIYLKK